MCRSTVSYCAMQISVKRENFRTARLVTLVRYMYVIYIMWTPRTPRTRRRRRIARAKRMWIRYICEYLLSVSSLLVNSSGNVSALIISAHCPRLFLRAVLSPTIDEVYEMRNHAEQTSTSLQGSAGLAFPTGIHGKYWRLLFWAAFAFQDNESQFPLLHRGCYLHSEVFCICPQISGVGFLLSNFTMHFNPKRFFAYSESVASCSEKLRVKSHVWRELANIFTSQKHDHLLQEAGTSSWLQLENQAVCSKARRRGRSWKPFFLWSIASCRVGHVDYPHGNRMS